MLTNLGVNIGLQLSKCFGSLLQIFLCITTYALSNTVRIFHVRFNWDNRIRFEHIVAVQRLMQNIALCVLS
jgi:hypothetical protein